jgi:hypothetical protein
MSIEGPGIAVTRSLTIDPGITYAVAGDFSTFTNQTALYSFQVATATTIPAAVNVTNQARFNTTAFQNYIPGLYNFSLQSSGGAVYFNTRPVPKPVLILTACGAWHCQPGSANGFARWG